MSLLRIHTLLFAGGTKNQQQWDIFKDVDIISFQEQAHTDKYLYRIDLSFGCLKLKK